MVLRILFISCILFSFTSCSNREVGAKKDENIKLADPKALYTMHCETCHGSKGNNGTDCAADLTVSTFSDNEILHVIENGNKKGMMPYKEIITNKEERLLLVEYVKTLRK